MYSIHDYGHMIADSTRMDPYAYALKEVVRPDSVVLDIGAATGIHALLACKFGARKVYAVEPEDAIQLAQELAQANGFADRIEFIHDISTNIDLPEQANIIVSDLRGLLPLFGQHIPSIIDARQRHLAPDGVLIPKRDTLWVGLVEKRSVYRELVKPWDSPYGLTMEAAKWLALNNWSDDNTDVFGCNDLLMDSQKWAVLDYASIKNPNVGPSRLVQRATKDGTAHGLLMWFDAEIATGIGFTNAPQSNRIADVYGRGFFPLLEPVPISAGDIITLDIQAELIDDGYVWSWHTCICSQGDLAAVKADFEQSDCCYD